MVNATSLQHFMIFKTNKKEAGTYVLASFLMHKVQACSSLITRKSKYFKFISTERFLQTFYFFG
mgnify:CR=1 FL=1|jgi:hypothetical protein